MFLPNTLRRRLNAMFGLNRFDAASEFGNTRPFFSSLLLSRAGKAGLELVTQARQFGQVSFMAEWLTEPCLIITKLAFGDGEVLPDFSTGRPVGVAHSFQFVQHRAARETVVQTWTGGWLCPRDTRRVGIAGE